MALGWVHSAAKRRYLGAVSNTVLHLFGCLVPGAFLPHPHNVHRALRGRSIGRSLAFSSRFLRANLAHIIHGVYAYYTLILRVSYAEILRVSCAHCFLHGRFQTFARLRRAADPYARAVRVCCLGLGSRGVGNVERKK